MLEAMKKVLKRRVRTRGAMVIRALTARGTGILHLLVEEDSA